MLTRSTKQAIDYSAAALAAVITAYVVGKRTSDWKIWAATAIIAAFVVYFIVSRLTKAAYLDGPAPVPTGGGCEGYDPTTLAQALHEDIYCNFCFRDEDLYEQVMGLADCQFIKLYNYYSEKYGKSLKADIAGENGGWGLVGTFHNNQKLIGARFDRLNIQ